VTAVSRGSAILVQSSSSSPPDEELVRDCLEGNEDAWSALIDKYRRLIFSIAIKYGLSRDDAAEIFQEVCLTLLGELPRLRDPRTLAAWLIRVTCNECSLWRKRQSRYVAVGIGRSSLESGEVAEIPGSLLEQVQREQAFHDSISELGPRCRQLIHMLFFTTPAVPYEEVAKLLGVAKGSIGFIRMQCLQRLRRHLTDKGFR
jgi:RNA polymerase sigma factor (sigma-70 family)